MLMTFNHRLARPPPMVGSGVSNGVIFTPQRRAIGWMSHRRAGDYPTWFKVVFYTEVVCQKIQHVPLVMSITLIL